MAGRLLQPPPPLQQWHTTEDRSALLFATRPYLLVRERHQTAAVDFANYCANADAEPWREELRQRTGFYLVQSALLFNEDHLLRKAFGLWSERAAERRRALHEYFLLCKAFGLWSERVERRRAMHEYLLWFYEDEAYDGPYDGPRCRGTWPEHYVRERPEEQP